MKNTRNNSAFHQVYKYLQRISCKTLGLAPWEVSSKQEDLLNVSYVGAYYNVLLIFLLIVLGICELFSGSLSDDYPGKLMPLIMVEVLFITILCASVIPLLYIIRQKKLINIYNRFKFVDKLLQKCENHKLKYDYTNDVIFVINLLATIWCIIIVDVWNFPAHRVFFENLPTVIGGGVMIQYAMLLNMVENKFRSIDLIISKFSLAKSNDNYPQIFSVTQKVLTRESILYNIDNLKSTYIELYGMCHDAADFYGVPILITILCFAERVIYCVYLCILTLLKVKGFYVSWLVVILRLIWIVFVFLVFTSSVTTIKKQNCKLAKTITLLTDKNTMDEKIMKKLLFFSNDLSHLEINLTACDILPLDRTLLGITTGTIAMYLVIAVQFGSSSISH
ncbi:uncharacterized protein LOC123265595 [Cotesia glomerata]|uniref:uncharacterized protein LOC123265595 n=1 Tax=Cotesia glomerata TaxID=32391 RepID=UPI001D01957F|nr:uncharacterized protein LOC123265595 [Cotesia glomerata]